MSVKLYTKTGDKGSTSLLGGKKVEKSHLRIEAYGSVDELNAHLGFLKDQEVLDNGLRQQMHWVQEYLFTMGGILAAEKGFSGFELPTISDQEVVQLEVWIDNMDDKLPKLKHFILPGGHPVVSWVHVCRTVCRRAERAVVALSLSEEIDKVNIRFLNRLSDYLFNFSRILTKELNVAEILWMPRGNNK